MSHMYVILDQVIDTEIYWELITKHGLNQARPRNIQQAYREPLPGKAVVEAVELEHDMSPAAALFFKAHFSALEELNYYHWAKMLGDTIPKALVTL